MKNLIFISCSILISLLFSQIATAHEIRPGFLRIQEVEENTYELTWKIPKSPNGFLTIQPIFSPVQELERISEVVTPDSKIIKLKFTSETPLRGTSIRIDKLEKTLVDVLIQIDLLDNTSYSFLVRPSQPSVNIPVESSFLQVIQTYTILGVEHILLGYDHLLFVLGLLLLIPGFKKLLMTITSFTLAHSITLVLAALGFINLPSQPVEAVIALSIVLLAKEAYDYHQGKISLTIQYPWVVAFLFGLIHGLGFAGALSEIGLPQKSIPSALLTFNVGVEIGQIMFVGVCLIVFRALKKYSNVLNFVKGRIFPYVIGSVGAFWLIERITGF